jgi:hypothetical protein
MKKRMKIAVQLSLLPGSNTQDKAKWAADHGVEGIELGVWGGGLPTMRPQAEEINGVVPTAPFAGENRGAAEQKLKLNKKLNRSQWFIPGRIKVVVNR